MMLAATLAMVFFQRRPVLEERSITPLLTLEIPFSLKSALKFGLLFLILQLAGFLGQRSLGQLGVYVISLFGGLFSSASAVAATTAMAAKGPVAINVAGNSAVIATLTSVLIHLPLVMRANEKRLTVRLMIVTTIIISLGLIGILLQPYLLTILLALGEAIAQAI